MPVMHTVGSPECGLTRSAQQTLSRSHCRNIKQKISQWEGRVNSGSCGDLLDLKPKRTFPEHNGITKSTENILDNRKPAVNHSKNMSLDFREGRKSNMLDNENNEVIHEENIYEDQLESPPFYSKSDSSFLDPEMYLPHGNFYTSPDMFKKNYLIADDLREMALKCKQRRMRSASTENEFDLRCLSDENIAMNSMDDSYYDTAPFNHVPSVNPVPKPRRTFRYDNCNRPEKRMDSNHRRRKSVDESDTESSDPSIPPSEPKKPATRKLRPRSKRLVNFLFSFEM